MSGVVASKGACSRRRFFVASGLALSVFAERPRFLIAGSAHETTNQELRDRVLGLLVGTLIGDALGGPVEFQPPERVHALSRGPKAWQLHERMDQAAVQAARERVRFRDYSELRPDPEPYAHWTRHAAAGTVTDDSRHKMVLMHALRHWQTGGDAKKPISALDLAHAYRNWRTSPRIASREDYTAIKDEWLYEYDLAIRWMDGSREVRVARPPSRLWNALPTCCGQMSLPPIAAIFSGEPEKAYRAAYSLAFFDNGFAKDMNSALVAGLSQALTLEVNQSNPSETWNQVIQVIQQTDPFGYRTVPWSQRAVERWMQVADQAVDQADGSPAKMFQILDDAFAQTIKWEAQVPFVATFACLKMCRYDPLAALQLSIEWGHDTDSYAQLLGAFIGALHGSSIFSEEMKNTVIQRLKLDYGEDLSEWVDVLLSLKASPPAFAE